MAVCTSRPWEMSLTAPWFICTLARPIGSRQKPAPPKGVPSHQSLRLCGHSQEHRRHPKPRAISRHSNICHCILATPHQPQWLEWKLYNRETRDESKGKRKLGAWHLSREVMPWSLWTRILPSALGHNINTGFWGALLGRHRKQWLSRSYKTTLPACRSAAAQGALLGPDADKVRRWASWLLFSPTDVGTYPECTLCLTEPSTDKMNTFIVWGNCCRNWLFGL